MKAIRSFLAGIEARLVADWRDQWRYWSVRLPSLGLLLGPGVQGISEAWTSMPPDLRHMIPYAQQIAWALFAGGVAAKFFPQAKTAALIQQKREERDRG
ncbi:hypothetical protein [Novosphingobium sp. 9]|uniref:DUF7940 domain-containing protein n=1 Tax=Novosphingobium sp. 9 TaxID=2025349 RepID=UPI0021B54389|nr:hypothetical protein [Novosphingobium sp. 9]